MLMKDAKKIILSYTTYNTHISCTYLRLAMLPLAQSVRNSVDTLSQLCNARRCITHATAPYKLHQTPYHFHSYLM